MFEKNQWIIKNQDDHKAYTEFIEQKFFEACDITKTALFKLIKNPTIDILIMSSSRWIGKSTLMAYWTLLNLIYHPDFNALWVTSYQTQNRVRLREPLEKALMDLVSRQVITKTQANMVFFTDKMVAFHGRKILFGDVNNLGNVLGTQPKGDIKRGIVPIFALVFFEELIYDGQSSEEERRAIMGADSIISGLQNRGNIIHPFLKLRAFYAFNPWISNSDFYQYEIEAKIPLGFEYVKDNMVELTQRNREILLKKGEIYRVFEDRSKYEVVTKAIWRGCYKLIPKQRFHNKNKHELEKIKDSKRLVDKRKYQVIYMGIHAPMLNNRYIYSAYMNEKPVFTKIADIYPQYILIGIDRGVIDHTALVIAVPYIDKDGWWKLYIHDVVSYSGLDNRSGIKTSKNIIKYLEKFIDIDWVRSYLQRLPIYILCEPKATDFNEFLWYDIQNNDLIAKYFNFMKGETYKAHWKINTRIDFVGKLLRHDRIVFNRESNSLLLWSRFQECIAKKNGEREETGKNKLDEINALEIAISKKRLRDNFYRRYLDETLS